jgi:1-deoxy-D-xylulose-5-phosphate reductoisomerase
MNAANEVAVGAFLGGRMAWSAIAEVVADTLAVHEPSSLVCVEDVLQADATARRVAAKAVERRVRLA